jgi:hypothetical protein
MMKKLIISTILLAFTAIYAGAMLIDFQVKSRDGNVVVSWQTSSETNLKHFVVERSTIKGGFIEVATINPESDRTYEYVDQSAYKTSDAVYVYRLKIVDLDGSVSYSYERTVAHNVSSAKRTWGSIKALFR